MNITFKIAAWSCIVGILLMGCYSSTLIALKGDERERIFTEEIDAIIINNDKTYKFDSPPIIVNNTVVGVANGDSISVPLSRVMLVNVKTFNFFTTVLVWSLPVFTVVAIITDDDFLKPSPR